MGADRRPAARLRQLRPQAHRRGAQHAPPPQRGHGDNDNQQDARLRKVAAKGEVAVPLLRGEVLPGGRTPGERGGGVGGSAGGRPCMRMPTMIWSIGGSEAGSRQQSCAAVAAGGGSGWRGSGAQRARSGTHIIAKRIASQLAPGKGHGTTPAAAAPAPEPHGRPTDDVKSSIICLNMTIGPQEQAAEGKGLRVGRVSASAWPCAAIIVPMCMLNIEKLRSGPPTGGQPACCAGGGALG